MLACACMVQGSRLWWSDCVVGLGASQRLNIPDKPPCANQQCNEGTPPVFMNSLPRVVLLCHPSPNPRAFQDTYAASPNSMQPPPRPLPRATSKVRAAATWQGCVGQGVGQSRAPHAGGCHPLARRSLTHWQVQSSNQQQSSSKAAAAAAAAAAATEGPPNSGRPVPNLGKLSSGKTPLPSS